MRNLEETFGYDLQNRLTGVRLGTVQTGTSAYDCYGRMTAKTADGQAVFSNAVYSTTAKPHAMDAAETLSGVFPSQQQNISYTCFDKVSQIVQGNKSLNYTYGYDHQRIFMEEHIGANVRTKRYVGNCEYVTETSGNTTASRWLTYLSGPTGVYAVVVTENSVNTIHYILKDNLGSWTTITNSSGTVEQRLSYDAWGNQRNPNTWANYTDNDNYSKPMFDRGFTGHEHLTAFGLINMNGRMYDPVMSSFLSADRYVQDPSSAQGFNRYAYCMYNPLRFVDPTGWAPRPGGGHGPDDPPPYVTMYGYSGYQLEDVIVTASPIDNHEFEYIPNTSGGFESQWGDANNSQSNNYGSGGGGGNHGGISAQKVHGDIPPIGTTIHTGNNLLLKAYWHYQFGRKEDLWVDASTLKLDYITQKDLKYYENGNAYINLFDYSKTAQSALTLGKIDLTPVGENLFEIQYDTYNFEIEWKYGLTTRNIGTAISGFIHGPVLDDVPLPTHWMDGKPCYVQPSVYWGGPFEIHFTNCVYIKP